MKTKGCNGEFALMCRFYSKHFLVSEITGTTGKNRNLNEDFTFRLVKPKGIKILLTKTSFYYIIFLLSKYMMFIITQTIGRILRWLELINRKKERGRRNTGLEKGWQHQAGERLLLAGAQKVVLV